MDGCYNLNRSILLPSSHPHLRDQGVLREPRVQDGRAEALPNARHQRRARPKVISPALGDEEIHAPRLLRHGSVRAVEAGSLQELPAGQARGPRREGAGAASPLGGSLLHLPVRSNTTRTAQHLILSLRCQVRVYRIQRDIPMPLVTSGVEKGNLRELALARMAHLGLRCRWEENFLSRSGAGLAEEESSCQCQDPPSFLPSAIRDVRTREVGIQDIHHQARGVAGLLMLAR